MIRINHILKEFFRNLYRNPGTAFGGFLSMALLFVLFDLFWIAAGTSDRFYDELLSDLKMEVFISEGVSDSSLAATRQAVASIPGIRETEYISKSDARRELETLVGIDLLIGYDTVNPLPRSYIVSFEPEYLTIDGLTGIEGRVLGVGGVSHVYYSRSWLEKAEDAKRVISEVGIALGVVILLALLISSANNMRLMTRARAVGFEQMRLQGAGGVFLAFPFLIEGLIISVFSAGVGWLVIFYFKDRVDFTRVEIIYPSVDQILLFCAGAAVVGVVSGYLGIRRLLRF
ncbi:MAG: hypothetical protein JSW34_13890 [Candidatus Zixiibacteriota bacterium]|nr:MAG: hypothetical protein JSW34_13890 [candidate division Zixibacteria bacterium]